MSSDGECELWGDVPEDFQGDVPNWDLSSPQEENKLLQEEEQLPNELQLRKENEQLQEENKRLRKNVDELVKMAMEKRFANDSLSFKNIVLEEKYRNFRRRTKYFRRKMRHTGSDVVDIELRLQNLRESTNPIKNFGNKYLAKKSKSSSLLIYH